MLKKGDVLLILLITGVLAAVVYMTQWNTTSANASGKLIAVIKQDDTVISTIDLNNLQGSKTIQLNGVYHATIIAENGHIRFQDSDCPDKTCVKTGWLDHTGEIAVCMPNKIIISISEK